MKIALYHDAVIPPRTYGGTERVVYWLCQGLHALGHQVVLLAARGSKLDFGEVIEIDDFSRWPEQVPADVDVLHLWNTPRLSLNKPFLVTIGGTGQMGEKFHPNTVFVSRHHAAMHGSAQYVHNGINAEDYSFCPQRKDHAVFLAKASWRVKNLAGAIEVARAANVELEVLGSRDWPLNLHRLLPRWRGVRYHGMANDEQKREVLTTARALIFPVRWHEPFGLALTEALVSGCYVLGTPYGSLPEIVAPSVGVLSVNADDLATALRNPEKFSPQACRDHVLQNGFTHLDMARRYVTYYEQLLTQGKLGDTTPTLQPPFANRELLPWN
ncbi:MAG: glycosyltransferase [Bdellovibrionales bacterium]|nr:glycosyltransferase [Bdellovibrionales bacterium]